MREPPPLPEWLYGDAAELIRACLDPAPRSRPPAHRLLALPFLACPPTRAVAAAAAAAADAAAAARRPSPPSDALLPARPALAAASAAAVAATAPRPSPPSAARLPARPVLAAGAAAAAAAAAAAPCLRRRAAGTRGLRGIIESDEPAEPDEPPDASKPPPAAVGRLSDPGDPDPAPVSAPEPPAPAAALASDSPREGSPGSWGLGERLPSQESGGSADSDGTTLLRPAIPSSGGSVDAVEEAVAGRRRRAAAAGGSGADLAVEREREMEMDAAFRRQWAPCGKGRAGLFGTALLVAVRALEPAESARPARAHGGMCFPMCFLPISCARLLKAANQWVE